MSSEFNKNAPFLLSRNQQGLQLQRAARILNPPRAALDRISYQNTPETPSQPPAFSVEHQALPVVSNAPALSGPPPSSVFDAVYPSVEECRKILAANAGSASGNRSAAKKLQRKLYDYAPPKEFRPINVMDPSAGLLGEIDTGELYRGQTHTFFPTETFNGIPYSLLNPQSIAQRLAEQVPGCEGIEQDAILKISTVVESHLRQLLSQLSEIAAHRLEPLRTNPNYSQLPDPRKQLRFLENLEKQAQTRRENMEKEAVLKAAAKSKSKGAGGAKAKEIRNADQLEKMSREANEAAIAALGGGSRALKRTWGTSFTLKAPQETGPGGAPLLRPKIRRVIMRDLQCALNCRNIPGDASSLKLHMAYGLLRSSSSE